ncbi:MAG: hypothetical protein GX557_12760 [Chloroflexi bacterium]|nr:hypothetical protein [Chloroflexota bacterium]
MSGRFPTVRLDALRKVYANDWHNAFTDLCRFGDHYYLSFRSCPAGHGVSDQAHIIVLRSANAHAWTKVLEFGVPLRDPRDPHLLIFRDRLWVYTGAWLVHPRRPTEYDGNEHLGYAVWSADGEHWEGPRALEGTYGHYIWRAASYAGRAYLCGRRKHDFQPTDKPEGPWQIMESAMLESEDGLIWRFKTLFADTNGDETAFLFEDDGTAVAVMRSGDREQPATLLRSAPPHTQWARTPFDRNVGGPLLARWGARYLVGGRKLLPGQPPRASLYWLADGQLHECLELPSGGDTSYPGFVPLDDTHALVSYYSSHECAAGSLPPSAIYLAEVSLA